MSVLVLVVIGGILALIVGGALIYGLVRLFSERKD